LGARKTNAETLPLVADIRSAVIAAGAVLDSFIAVRNLFFEIVRAAGSDPVYGASSLGVPSLALRPTKNASNEGGAYAVDVTPISLHRQWIDAYQRMLDNLVAPFSQITDFSSPVLLSGMPPVTLASIGSTHSYVHVRPWFSSSESIEYNSPAAPLSGSSTPFLGTQPIADLVRRLSLRVPVQFVQSAGDGTELQFGIVNDLLRRGSIETQALDMVRRQTLSFPRFKVFRMAEVPNMLEDIGLGRLVDLLDLEVITQMRSRGAEAALTSSEISAIEVISELIRLTPVTTYVDNISPLHRWLALGYNASSITDAVFSSLNGGSLVSGGRLQLSSDILLDSSGSDAMSGMSITTSKYMIQMPPHHVLLFNFGDDPVLLSEFAHHTGALSRIMPAPLVGKMVTSAAQVLQLSPEDLMNPGEEAISEDDQRMAQAGVTFRLPVPAQSNFDNLGSSTTGDQVRVNPFEPDSPETVDLPDPPPAIDPSDRPVPQSPPSSPTDDDGAAVN
jgi:hypothetical protein